MLGSIPDLLRLVAVPVFGWTAYRDVKTRRVPNRTWLPLLGLAVVLLAWEAYAAWTGPAVGGRLFFLRAGISVAFVVPLSYVFWRIGGFGGADAKAFMLVAVLFPVYPTYVLESPSLTLPLVRTPVGVFSLTVLSNTVLAGVAYPLALAGRNLSRGRLSLAMFVGRPVPVESVTAEYGRLLETPAGFTRTGLDVDALRMYLRWRGATLSELRSAPDRCRDPASLPEEPNPPGDGAIATDGGRTPAASAVADPWGAEAFLADIEGSAYGTTPDQLRDGLELLAARETVWLSPGIPFLVPLFAGLVVSLTYGDALFATLRALGVA